MIVDIALCVVIICLIIKIIRIDLDVYVQRGLIEMLLTDRKNFYDYISKEEDKK